MASSIKLSADVSSFKQGMKDAEAAVKSLDEQLKVNEAYLKLNGNQEQYMSNQAFILNEQIKAQATALHQAEAALKAMKDSGVDPASKAYQDMQAKVNSAHAKLIEMRADLQGTEKDAKGAKTSTESMNEELKKVGKGVNWENLTTGIGKVNDMLERGARAAINFGKRVLNSAKGSTGWADELKTLADEFDIPTDRLQRMEKVSEFIDTDVEAILSAQQRMKAATKKSSGVQAFEEILGISLNDRQNADDLFWDVGDALLNMSDAFDKEDAAQKIFGRSWRELMPLFKAGREEYEKMLSEQSVLTDEQVDKLATADDAIKSVEQEIEQLKNQFWADNADKITGLMQWFVDNKDAVVAALTAIAAAFGAMKLGEFALNLQKTIKGFKELNILNGSGASGTGGTSGTGTPAVTGTGTQTGGGWSKLLNNLALFGAANAMYNATEGRLKAQRKEFEKQMEGMTPQEKSDYVVMQTLGWTQEQLDEYKRAEAAEHLATQSQGRFFGSDEVLHKDRRGNTFQGGEYHSAEESVDRMTSVMETNTTKQTTASNNAADAVTDMTSTLPPAIEAAIRRGMSGVTIVIDDRGMSTIGSRVSSMFGNAVAAMVK